ncbi:MAG TPA: NAD(+)/NADH kinase [Clostridiaceae bacterium]|nr:NAD(+)/NADH kinase [Clostridiaceae bacterium]
MKNVGVIVNTDRDTELKYTGILASCLCKAGANVVMLSEIAEKLNIDSCFIRKKSKEREIIKDADILVCLGGDGTFLKAARAVYKKNIPILGINLGNLGFLTEVEKNEIEEAVNCLMVGKYIVEERMMLEATIIRNDKIIGNDTALNDIVISRGALSRILRVKTYINDVFVDMFPGDGLIVSSPTGSTAYSLAVGGPIVEPDIDLIIVSPICPHILYSRSFITASNRKVRAVIDEDYGHKAMVTVDGQKGYEIRGGDIVEVQKSNYTIKLIRINPKNFYNILRSKIYFRGESLRKNEV